MENANFKRALGNLILRLRKERNISQERLALEAEIDRTRLGEIERGEANATIDTLSKIAAILNQTLGSLIEEAEEIASGVVKKPIPTTKPEYINRNVPLVQVEVAQLKENDWVVHERAERSKRTRTAVTLLHATNKLRKNSVYLEPSYLTPALRKIILGPQLPEAAQE
jgi:transcriptional regulator with XRE-family HTH domain